MKTAMQEMLEDLQLKYKILSDSQMIQGCASLEGSIEYAEYLIIKEKEQIMDAWNNGVGFDEILDDCETLFKQYYNETYNQNK